MTVTLIVDGSSISFALIMASIATFVVRMLQGFEDTGKKD